MKLLTLNTHSLIEENYEQKLRAFTEAIATEQPDMIALQEVNQSVDAAPVKEPPAGYTPANEDVVLRADNHVLRVAEILGNAGIFYSWTWLPLKCGYCKYDEGIAWMSRSEIADVSTPLVSTINDYYNWKTRRLLGIRTKERAEEWYYSVHYGWWDDPEEPFLNQWQRTLGHMQRHKRVWLMGDFNNAAGVRGEGYERMLLDGWYDSYLLAEEKDAGMTVCKVIDGWRDKGSNASGMRIDQIWCNERAEVRNSRVIFNGINYPIVSDHCGVIIETR